MTNPITIDVYPKNAEVACMVIKTSNDFFRENHLFEFNKFVNDLESITIKLASGLPIMDSFTLRDKRQQEYTMICALTPTDATLTILKKINQKKKNPAFCWKGTVGAFVHAVRELLRKLGRLAQ